jgi:transcriptional regulator with XRE-family HTH domain
MISVRRPLNNEEINDTKRLRNVWDEKLKTASFTQKQVSEAFGFKNQSAISQYLNGRIPLNLEVAAKFAKYLKVPLREISPRYSEVTSDLMGEETLINRVSKQLMLKGHCQMVEMDEQAEKLLGGGAWYVLDPAQKSIGNGAYAVKTEIGLKIIKVQAQHASYRIFGITDDIAEPLVMPAQAAALIAVEGKVIYKIERV